jgi:hypothetical protein
MRNCTEALKRSDVPDEYEATGISILLLSSFSPINSPFSSSLNSANLYYDNMGRNATLNSEDSTLEK